MAEVEITVIEEVKRLKNEIKALRKELKKPNASKEEILTFEMLGRYRHVINQQVWLWQMGTHRRLIQGHRSHTRLGGRRLSYGGLGVW